jgi:hypothetical protein
LIQAEAQRDGRALGVAEVVLPVPGDRCPELVAEDARGFVKNSVALGIPQRTHALGA